MAICMNTLSFLNLDPLSGADGSEWEVVSLSLPWMTEFDLFFIIKIYRVYN